VARINYSEDDEDYPGQYALWQANCDRSFAGRHGQATLREVEAALLAMPSKRLHQNIVAHEGEVCAVGAYLVHKRATEKGITREQAQRELEAECGEDWEQSDLETDELGVKAGMPRLVAWMLVWMNDISTETKWVTVEGPMRHDHQYYDESWRKAHVVMTPEERYDAVLAFVRSKIKAAV
jgi:hypothetical protein